jgi:hypothetical protein
MFNESLHNSKLLEQFIVSTKHIISYLQKTKDCKAEKFSLCFLFDCINNLLRVVKY